MFQKNTETKPFYLTTEFWLHTLAQLLLWVEAIPLTGTPQWVQVAVSGGLAIAYIISRGLAKGGSPYEIIKEVVEDLPHLGGAGGAPSGGSGAKGVTQDPASLPADPGAQQAERMAQVRQALSEDPAIVQQLKNEGVIQ